VGAAYGLGIGEGGTGYGRGTGYGAFGGISGSGGGEAGRGTTNIAREGGIAVSERDEFPGRQSADTAYREREFVKIYAPGYTEVRPEDRFIPGKLGQGPIMGTVDIMGEPRERERAFVPYSQVLPSYRRAAEEALEKENIPLEYRTFIREYFDNL
jgi:hypothetical protein